MTPRRRRTRSRAHPCRFSDCSSAFATVTELKAHEAAHNADKPIRCTFARCSSRFATVADRDAHVRASHARQRSSKRLRANDSAILAVGEELTQPSQADEPVAKSYDADDRKEAIEIAENAAYLADQMKVARSCGIAKWQGEDYRNAHQWAVWVQSAVGDFSDNELLKQMLMKKGLSIRPLRNAERAFFDSVLGFEGLTAEILEHVISAVTGEADEAAAKEEQEASFSHLMAALAAAVERKRVLKSLDCILRDMNAVMPKTNSASVTDRQDTSAKAEILLTRHGRLTETEVQQHLKKVGINLNDEMLDIIIHEIKIAVKSTDRKGIAAVLQNFVRERFEQDAEGLMQSVDEEPLIQLCELDFLLFDSYLKFLLEQYKALVHGDDEQFVRVRDGKMGLKEAAIERVKQGRSADLGLGDIERRIRGLLRRPSPIGYITSSVVTAFCIRLNIRNIADS